MGDAEVTSDTLGAPALKDVQPYRLTPGESLLIRPSPFPDALL